MSVLTPLDYKGLAPKPLPEEDIPTWKYAEQEEERFEAERAKVLAREAEVKEPSKYREGWRGAVDRFANVATVQIDKLALTTTHTAKSAFLKQVDSLTQSHYKEHFAASGDSNETPLAEFTCKLLVKAEPSLPNAAMGKMIVSTHRFMFYQGRRTVSASLTDVVSIQKGLVTPTWNGDYLLHAIPHPDAIPTALVVYTRHAQQFVFFDFEALTVKPPAVYRDAFGSIDASWRSRVQVPNPLYKYLPESAVPAVLRVARCGSVGKVRTVNEGATKGGSGGGAQDAPGCDVNPFARAAGGAAPAPVDGSDGEAAEKNGGEEEQED